MAIGLWFFALCATVILASCSTSQSRYSQPQDSAPQRPVDVSQVKDAVPRPEPRSRYGNPQSYVVNGKRYHTLTASKGYTERGIASWYGTKFHGHRTSSGEPYDMYQMSAAHKSLPLPTYARVTNLRNGKSVIVKINDRGPFHDNRLIDLSYAAASKLEILGEGTGLVEVKAIDPHQYAKEQSRPSILASKPKVTQPASQAPVGATPIAASPNPAVYLQVGAFLSRSNAERLQSKLTGLQMPAKLHISEGMSNEKRVFRVRIGPLDTIESVDQLTQLLVAQGIQSPSVVID